MQMQQFVLKVALLITLAASPVVAQTSLGSIGGTVTDPGGAAVQGASVVATNGERREVRDTTTGQLGQYRIDALEPGSYRVTISRKGFAPVTLDKIQVSGSVIASVNAKLKVGGLAQSMVVTASGGALQTESGTLSQSISAPEVHNVPVQSLNPYALATTLAGCSTVTDGSYTFTNGVAYSCNGSRPRGNNFLLEGQDNNDASIHGQGLQPQNLDSVQEVAVLLNSSSAEFGHGGGAIANLIYRSGTNRFHGALWDRLSNSSLDANDHANVLAGIPKSKYRENLFGFNFGGPLKRNKLFFFISYQGDNYRSSANGGVLTLPTENGFATLQQYAANPRIAAMLAAYGSLRGDPNRPAPAIPLGRDPATGADRGSVEFGLANRIGVPLQYDAPEFDATGDYNIGPNDQLHLRYVRNRFETPYDFFHFANNLPGFDVEQSGHWQNAGIAYTHLFGPSVLNEFRLSYSRMGLSFLPREDNIPADRAATVTIDGIQGWGASPLVPQGRFHNTYQLQDTVSWRKGRHFLKFGVDLAEVRARDAIPYNYYGAIQYRAGGGYQALANYLDDYSGASAMVNQTFGSPIVHANLISQNYFVQDSWKIRPNLTLELGLRYEYNGAPANQLAYPAIDYNNLSCFPCVVRQKADRQDFGPRIGFAYSPNFWKRLLGEGQSVVRGGFGVFYDTEFTNILDNTQATSPNSVAAAMTSPPPGPPCVRQAALICPAPSRGIAHWSSSYSKLTPAPDAHATVDSQVAHLLSPEILQWHLDVQRELPARFILDIGYVGTRGEHLYANTFANPFLPNGQRLIPSRGAIVIRDNSGDSIYHALQVQVEHRYSRGFLLRTSYTLSKMIDDASEIFTPGVSQNGVPGTWSSVPPVQYPVPRGVTDRSLSAFDHRHRLTFTYIYDVPSLAGRGAFSTGAGYLLNGWQVSGITSFQSGTPYNVITGFDSNGDGIINDRPSLGNPHAPLASYAINGAQAGLSPSRYCDGPTLWFFNQCTDVSLSQVHWYVPADGVGNVGRNSLIGPWYTSWAFSATRNFPLPRHQKLQFRAEFFNPFNQTHKDGDGYWPNMQLVSGIFPSRFGTPANFANFAASLHGGRTIRMLLKYSF